ncbi:MAG: LytTR family DNA-binding domain-containing protein [Chitinophagaceae bacterium]|jgi:two-component system LytT family response regulator|nr:LytTR family DNA-binding domain-containing protein [Chitinophagaceae bacterium]
MEKRQPIKVLIVDDEPSAAQVLLLLIERHLPEVAHVRQATTIQEAVSLVQQFQPDLLFQDIVMPEQNGFDFLSSLGRISFEVVFTTAYDEYAVRAIRFSALDYLLKPIDAVELRAAFERFLEKRRHKTESDLLVQNLLQNLQQRGQESYKLAIPTMQGAILLEPATIVRLEGDGNYTHFYLTDHRKLVSAKTLKEYAELLSDHGFVRIHKSHLVNQRFVQQYLNEGAVVLSDGLSLPVSRQRKQEVASYFKRGNTPGDHR